MYVVCVTILVKPELIQEFIRLTLDNASNTRKEPGNVRFDVLQGDENPARFMLYECYHGAEDVKAHQQTAHYLRWKGAAEALMAQPRTKTINRAVFFGERAVG